MSSIPFATELADLAPLTVAGPFALAALLAAKLPFPFRRSHAELVAAAGALLVGVLCLLLLGEALDSEGPVVSRIGGWEPRAGGVVVGINLAFDSLGAALALLAAVLVGTALVFAWRFFEAVGPTFHALILVFLGALCGFALTGDLFNMFVFFELMSVSAYALTAYRIERAASLQGALTFAVTNSVGAVMILFGIALLYGRTGVTVTTPDANADSALRMSRAYRVNLDMLALVALITGGFLVKAAIVPFHFWLADAYAVAPTPAAIVFTGVMSDLGIYAVARIYLTVFQAPLEPHAEGLRAVLVGFAVVTALVGAVMALVQDHLKRLLAFVTISQIGLALIGIGLLTPEGAAGAALLIPADGLLRAGLVVCLGALLHRCGSVYQSRLHGRGRVLPRAFPIFFAAGILGLAALPPLGGFPGKALVEEAAAEVGYGWVASVFMIATLLTAAALLRAGARVFFGIGPVCATGTDPREPPIEESELTGSRPRPRRDVRQCRGPDRRRTARQRRAGHHRRRTAERARLCRPRGLRGRRARTPRPAARSDRLSRPRSDRGHPRPRRRARCDRARRRTARTAAPTLQASARAAARGRDEPRAPAAPALRPDRRLRRLGNDRVRRARRALCRGYLIQGGGSGGRAPSS
jgi:multicomponent Na+:H+ antiporter subunit D